MSAPPANPKRAHMRNRASIGTYWQNKRNQRVYQVRQCWRTDRKAQLVLAEETDQPVLLSVTFAELRRDYTQVGR